MSSNNKPKPPAVPDEDYYPIERLYLFDRHDRGSWEAEYGHQAPPWDAGRRPKFWADRSAMDGVTDPDNTFVEYDYFDLGSRSFQKMKLSTREAAAPNLPGDYVYPKYMVAPTPAVVTDGKDGVSPLNPEVLSLKEEAATLMRELAGQSVVESTFAGAGPYRVDWRGEKRRIWMVRLGRDLYTAAGLLKRKYKNGIGAPGNWTFESNGQPRWLSPKQENGEQDHRAEVPFPVRPLAGNEALYLGNPINVIVYRTDRDSRFNRPGDDATGFPADAREMLERIDANVQKLVAFTLMKS